MHAPRIAWKLQNKLAVFVPSIKRRNPVKKKHFRHFSPHFYAMCVSNVCAGIDKVTMKAVFQAAKKVNILGAQYGLQVSERCSSTVALNLQPEE